MHSDIPSPRSQRGLDFLAFFVAGIQAGFGPFIAAFLASRHWTQTDIGLAFSIGGIVGLLGQVPGGMLIDATRHKRGAALWSIVAIASAAVLLVTWQARLPVFVAFILQSVASCALGPAIAAISLAAAGHAGLAERLGRNTRYASIGNGVTSGVMGVLGSLASGSLIFWLAAALALPAAYALWAIGPLPDTEARAERRLPSRTELRLLLTDGRLQAFALSCALFHLANAAMMPLAAADAARQAGAYAELLVGAAIVAPQVVIVLISVRIGRAAEQRGRRGVLLLGWGMLPVRGAILALLPSPWLLPVAQALSGVSDAVFAIMLPLVAADITRGSPRFNLCVGILNLMMVLGATLSTALAGVIADLLGVRVAFLALALAGAVATLVVWLRVPETREADATAQKQHEHASA
jgi:predicted MFS family arabinose efflux permease